MRQTVWSLVVLAAVTLSSGHSLRPPYIECQTSEECGKGSCCVIGMGRYSIPTCQPQRDRGEICRPFGEPANTTLHYPDGAVVQLTGVYYLQCPCLGGLNCQESDGNGEDNPQCGEDKQLSTNHVYDYGSQSFEDLRS